MFPKDACLICSKCLTRNVFKQEDFREIQRVGYIQCCRCSLKNTGPQHLSDFFKHYSWLAALAPVMTLNGFRPASIKTTAGKDESGHEYSRATHILFTCMECGKPCDIDLEQNSEWDKALGCLWCGSRPAHMVYVEAFFNHFTQIHNAQIMIHEFQADIFPRTPPGPDIL